MAVRTQEAPSATSAHTVSSRQLYRDLLADEIDQPRRRAAQRYLEAKLAQAAAQPSDLPDDARKLTSWIEDNTARVGREYRAYLQARREGGPRRFFSSKSHALYYLGCIAPTKLVDGAWLYGLVHRWDDPRLYALIRTYLEELGEGQRGRNHVAIYKRLLAAHGCENWDRLSESHYVQGTIQLALGYSADRFLPELIGYNLGYEQLPLHMLITAYELNELGIDPYYFTLHITVDNADSGHAAQAARSVLDAQPLVGDRDSFYQRVANGYRLNTLGLGARAIADAFDLEQEVIAMLRRKGAIGRFAHSDYHSIGGRTVTQWLADPADVPALLESLQTHGWIKRHQPPRNSRFWRLVTGDGASMYGVFNAYEQQLLHDWIAGDLVSDGATSNRHMRAPSLRRDCAGADSTGTMKTDDFNSEIRLLEQQLATRPTHDAAMRLLASYMSPARHHTAAGLRATQMYAERLG